jgi:2-keto-4-pentenoate hydratase/2-oxohepta-3-ene-1,7-dioic acid hydratase in catechol pathway
VPDPNALSIRAWLGDRQIAEDSTANLTFSVARVLSHLNRYVTLEAGDIVHFGTAVDPRRFALREANILRDPSDIRIEIDGLGTLINPVRVVVD